MNTLRQIDAIDALLPQTQCGKCGHPGCRPYAESIASGEAINKCPPGGQQTLEALAELLQIPPLPLEQPAQIAKIAFIREDQCIGCTKCIQACPVDAIVGAAKLMHTVISDECSGCELCLAPCPVDCIELIPLSPALAQIQRQRAKQFRARYQARNTRLARNSALRPVIPDLKRQTEASDGNKADGLHSTQLKRLKQEAALAKIAYEKLRKQLDKHPDSPFAAQLDLLRSTSQQAEHALQAALAISIETAPPKAEADALSLKQAKIDAAMSKAQLDKAIKAFADTGDSSQRQQLDKLRNAAKIAQQRLELLQPAPSVTPNSAGEQALRAAKIELATCRSALRAGERRNLDEERLALLRSAYNDAQAALHKAEQECGKPIPQHILVDKSGLSPQLRQLKTDLAYARADLNKLRRNETSDNVLLQAAEQRLAAAERRLQEHGASLTRH